MRSLIDDGQVMMMIVTHSVCVSQVGWGEYIQWRCDGSDDTDDNNRNGARILIKDNAQQTTYLE